MPHTCNHQSTHVQATTWSGEDPEEGEEGWPEGCAQPFALTLPSPPPINFSYPAGPGSGLHSPHLVSPQPPQRPRGAGVSVLERKL